MTKGCTIQSISLFTETVTIRTEPMLLQLMERELRFTIGKETKNL